MPGSGRQLIQVLLPPVAQVQLDDLGKEVPLQQGVSQGQQLAHRLVEVLQERRENKRRPRPQWLCLFREQPHLLALPHSTPPKTAEDILMLHL